MKTLLTATVLSLSLMTGVASADALVAENGMGGKLILTDQVCYMGDGGGMYLNASTQGINPINKEEVVFAGCWTFNMETETVIIIWDDPNGPDIRTYPVDVFELQKGL